MKYALALCLFLSAVLVGSIADAQKKPLPPGSIDKDTLGMFVNSKNQKVYIFGIFQVTQETINYKTQTGDLAYESINKVKWAKMGDRVFLAYLRDKKAKHKSLMEVAARNDKYILMRSYETYNGIYYYNYYIYDYQGNIVVEDTYDLDKEEIVRDTMLKYLGNCPAFVSKMDYNKKHEKFILNDINNLACPGAPKLDAIMRELENEVWKIK